jgi:hypothetical protein
MIDKVASLSDSPDANACAAPPGTDSRQEAEMKLAIMQPYFFPYIGYFQLIKAADLFVVYDNIKYTKKGWINRNRILQHGKDVLLSLPLKKDSDFLDVKDRELAADFEPGKLLNQLKGAYSRAPMFAGVFPIIEAILQYEDRNLFRFLHNSLVKTCTYLKILTPIRISSEIRVDHSLKNQDKVLALCEAAGAKTYINAIGGRELYAKSDFAARDTELKFIKSKPFEYPQFGNTFVPWLSIIDVMMFNSVDFIAESLMANYELI